MASIVRIGQVFFIQFDLLGSKLLLLLSFPMVFFFKVIFKWCFSFCFLDLSKIRNFCICIVLSILFSGFPSWDHRKELTLHSSIFGLLLIKALILLRSKQEFPSLLCCAIRCFLSVHLDERQLTPYS